MHSVEIQVFCWSWNWSNSRDQDVTVALSCTSPIVFDDLGNHVSSITDDFTVVFHEVGCDIRDQLWGSWENFGPFNNSLFITFFTSAIFHLIWEVLEKSPWVVDTINNWFHRSFGSIIDDWLNCFNHSAWWFDAFLKIWDFWLSCKCG